MRRSVADARSPFTSCRQAAKQFPLAADFPHVRTRAGRHRAMRVPPLSAVGPDVSQNLARLKRRESGLVVAPHPYFPSATCLWRYLDERPDLFDAVEYNAMFTAHVNFNRRAERWAARHGKPIVGNCDVHQLRQLGTTYSLVDAAP